MTTSKPDDLGHQLKSKQDRLSTATDTTQDILRQPEKTKHNVSNAEKKFGSLFAESAELENEGIETYCIHPLVAKSTGFNSESLDAKRQQISDQQNELQETERNVTDAEKTIVSIELQRALLVSRAKNELLRLQAGRTLCDREALTKTLRNTRKIVTKAEEANDVQLEIIDSLQRKHKE